MPVSSAKVAVRRRGSSTASSSTASATVRVSTVTWQGRSAAPDARRWRRRNAWASWSEVTPANRSGAWTAKPSSRPASRGTDRAPVLGQRHQPVGDRRRRPGTRAAGRAGGRARPSRAAPRRGRPRRDRAGAAGLELEEDGRHEQELGEHVHGVRRPWARSARPRRRRPPGRAGCPDVDLVRGHQLQEQVDRTLEGRRRDGNAHMTDHTEPDRRRPRTSGGPPPRPLRWPPMATVFSGIQPSGDLHLGNYLGRSATGWPPSTRTTPSTASSTCTPSRCEIDPEELRRAHPRRRPSGPLAVGLDPDVCTLFVQSHVPEHTQLAWLLECTATLGELQPDDPVQGEGRRARGRSGPGCSPTRCSWRPTSSSTTPTQVPVGDDQRQHLELTRDLAIRFNNRYGADLRRARGGRAQGGCPGHGPPAPRRTRCPSRSTPRWAPSASSTTRATIERKITPGGDRHRRSRSSTTPNTSRGSPTCWSCLRWRPGWGSRRSRPATTATGS